MIPPRLRFKGNIPSAQRFFGRAKKRIIPLLQQAGFQDLEQFETKHKFENGKYVVSAKKIFNQLILTITSYEPEEVKPPEEKPISELHGRIEVIFFAYFEEFGMTFQKTYALRLVEHAWDIDAGACDFLVYPIEKPTIPAEYGLGQVCYVINKDTEDERYVALSVYQDNNGERQIIRIDDFLYPDHSFFKHFETDPWTRFQANISEDLKTLYIVISHLPKYTDDEPWLQYLIYRFDDQDEQTWKLFKEGTIADTGFLQLSGVPDRKGIVGTWKGDTKTSYSEVVQAPPVGCVGSKYVYNYDQFAQFYNYDMINEKWISSDWMYNVRQRIMLVPGIDQFAILTKEGDIETVYATSKYEETIIYPGQACEGYPNIYINPVAHRTNNEFNEARFQLKLDGETVKENVTIGSNFDVKYRYKEDGWKQICPPEPNTLIYTQLCDWHEEIGSRSFTGGLHTLLENIDMQYKDGTGYEEKIQCEDCGWNGGCPAPYWNYYTQFIFNCPIYDEIYKNQTDLIFPIQISNVDYVSRTFVSIDQKTGLRFFGFQTDQTGMKIYCRESIDAPDNDITDFIIDIIDLYKPEDCIQTVFKSIIFVDDIEEEPI